MANLNSRSFFWQWQNLYAASNPGYLKNHWQVDDVDWTKEGHSYWGEQYSVQFEIHRLEYRPAKAAEWTLLVVVERWWGPDREKTIRDTSWCRAVNGRADRIQAWVKKQTVRAQTVTAFKSSTGMTDGAQDREKHPGGKP